jgi:Ca-activated chloride channel family protein
MFALRFGSAACSLLVLFVVLSVGRAASAQVPTPRVSDSLTTLTVTVSTPDGNLVGGLTQNEFTVTDDKVVRPIRSFSAADEPLSVGILVDTSGSMNQQPAREIARTDRLIAGLSTFIQLSNPANQYFLVSFGNEVKLLSDWTKDILPALNRIQTPQDKGGTPFYDALWASIEKVKTGAHRKRVILVFSDGLDNSSRHKFEEILTLLRSTDVLLYPIGVYAPSHRVYGLGIPADLANIFSSRLNTGGRQALIDFAETTGGLAVFPDDSKALNWFANKIATELRHQYRLGFEVPTSGQPDKWRRLKVTVTNRPNAPKEFRKLKVRARAGYSGGS